MWVSLGVRGPLPGSESNRTFKVLCKHCSLTSCEGTLCSSLAWARLLQGLSEFRSPFSSPACHILLSRRSGPE